MLVSVIIPNYNHAIYLKQRINSVLDQTYQDLELIILDDSSTDNSREVLEHYRSHPKVSILLFNELNSGSTFKQWEKGIELAKGEWIWIAESDDYCENNFLENLVNNISLGEHVVISYCQSKVIDEKGQILGDMLWHTDDLSKVRWRTNYYNNGKDEIKHYLLYKNTIPNASAVLFNKAAYLNTSDEYQKLKLTGDWMLWIQLLKQGNIVYSAKALNYFRTHSHTTRILDTYEKKKLRTVEEFKILKTIKKNIEDVPVVAFNKRLKDICYSYLHNTTKKELVKELLGFKRTPMPRFSLLKSYLIGY
jgi:glycosyltransferase involved in cell wall biosynthesis